MKSGSFWCPESTKNWEGRLIKRLLKIQSDRVIWLFNGSHLSTKSRKMVGVFFRAQNQSLYQRKRKEKKEKAWRWKEGKDKKESPQSWLLRSFWLHERFWTFKNDYLSKDNFLCYFEEICEHGAREPSSR